MPDFFNPSMLRFRSMLGQTPVASDDPRTGGIYGQGAARMPMIPSGDVNAPRVPIQNNTLNDQPPDISQIDFGAPERDTIGQEDEITKLVNKLYTPGHEIADKFNEVWNQMPQRQKPSVLRKIVASMVGAGPGGIKEASAVLDEPYNDARQEWMDKLKMLQPLLGDERYANTNERMLATNAATQATANRRIAETERHNKEAEDVARTRAEATKDRAAVYRDKANNPDHKFVEDEQGQLMSLDPKTGTMTYVLNEDGVPVKSLKNLDARERQQLDIQARKDIAAIQGKNTIEAARVRGEQARATEAVKIAGRKEVKETKDANGEVTSRTTITYDADGNQTGSRTETFTKKPVKPEGGKVEVPSNINKIKMKAPDGRILMVPADKVAEAEQRGATKVK